MRISKHIFFFITVFLTSFFVACASAPSVLLTYADNQKTVSLKKGELLKISLDAQLSTGYGWQISSISCAEQYGEIKVETSSNAMTGGKDLQHIVFKAVKTGSGHVELKYVRPWISSDTPLRFYKIYITVHE